MLSKETINYSLRNLAHRKSRSALTVLSIFIGITAIFIFVAFGIGLYSYVEEFTTDSSADKISIMAKGSGTPGMDDTFALTEDDLDAIEKTSGVYEADGLYIQPAEITQGSIKKYVFLMGYNPKKPLVMELSNIDVEKGRQLESGDDGKVVLGYNYMLDDKIMPKGYDINDKIEIQGEDHRIIGFVESIGNPQDDSNIYVTADYAEELYSNDTKGYGWVIARVDLNNIDGVVANVERSLRKSRGLEEGKEDFFVQSWQDMLNTYKSVLNGVVGFILLIALISVLVSAINTANTMITSVIERIREIGIIKSIGARNSEVFAIFLFESGFLGFVAGVLGVLLGWGMSSVIYNLLDNLGYGFLSPAYSVQLFGGLILFATLTGAISGVIPARNASKINPVDALRYE